MTLRMEAECVTDAAYRKTRCVFVSKVLSVVEVVRTRVMDREGKARS